MTLLMSFLSSPLTRYQMGLETSINEIRIATVSVLIFYITLLYFDFVCQGLFQT